jgi:hypothetical protein
MTITEILALIFVIAIVLKLLMLLCCQKKAYKKAKYFLERPKTAIFLSLVVLVVAGYFLFQEMSVIQVAAAAWIVLAIESILFFACDQLDEMKEVYKKAFTKKGFLKRNWFGAILMLIIAFWLGLKLFV